MYHLIKNEFIKIRKTRVFIISFFVMGLSPVFSIFIMSLGIQDITVTDFNLNNITLLSFIGSRTIFPVVAMTLIKIEYNISGYESYFVTPIRKSKLIIAKAFTSFIWMIMLVLFSVLLIVITESVLFSDTEVWFNVLKTIKNYFYLLVYSFPIQIFAMLLTFMFNSILVPSIFLTVFIIVEYFIQFFGMLSYAPCILPEFISGSIYSSSEVVTAFSIIIAFGLISLFVLNYMIRQKDFID